MARLCEERYLELLDWTGRQVRSGKRGQLSPHLRPMLARLDFDIEAWIDNVARYGGLIHWLVGEVHRRCVSPPNRPGARRHRVDPTAVPT